MKLIFRLLVVLVWFSSCDDGDFTIDSFDFSGATANSCNSGASGFFVYKINGSEVLLVQLPENLFVNEITPPNTPRTQTISSSNRVIYRLYSGAVNTGVLCTNIPPANPSVVNEWLATAGTIEVTTTANRSVNEQDNSSIITGYSHLIVFKNINFDKGNGSQQLFTELNFGSYVTNVAPPASFVDLNVNRCGSSTDFLFKISGTQALTLRTAPGLFENQITQPGSPRTALIDTNNSLALSYYSDNINAIFMCSQPTPSIPTLSQLWQADFGVSGQSGLIEVVTTEEFQIPTDNQSPLIGYRHTVVLKNMTLTRNGVSFQLGNAYPFGSFVTSL
ncbi:hypothetical protein [Flavobacterium sp.]|uniref:hypothetical protein n=1 Tax=Flavobacterium sp. TaxID=239 RepID=UPI002FD93DFB